MFKNIYLINVDEKQNSLLVDVPGKLTNIAWSPDSKNLAFVAGVDSSDPVAGSLFSVQVQIESPWDQIRNYTLDFEGSVTDVKWVDNKTMIFSADESVNVTLSEIRLGEESRTVLTHQDGIVFNRIQIIDGKICMVANTRQHPNELYQFDLKKRAFKRLTVTNPWLSEIDLARQEKISYEARDGLTVEGVLQYPVDFDPEQKYPMICVIHGGPESCIKDGWTTSYSRWGNIAAAEGYFVFMPNYRASSGRGVAYSKMDHMDLGDEEFLDVIDGIEYLASKGLIDKNKVGIGGGSYGGYFSALGATKYSEYFAAAIPFVGVTNQLSKVNLTDIPYEIYQVHWTIWPNDDPELFYDRSPVKYSSNNKTPTLILHGKEDTRVHPSQSLERAWQ
jgi:dipeptidyl aminopeptidase/acylaminoacyl peptidase